MGIIKLYIAFGHDVEQIIEDKCWDYIDRVDIEEFKTEAEETAFKRGMNIHDDGMERGPSTYCFLTEDEYKEWEECN